MLNLKKTAVAVLAFSSGAVFAGTMGPVCSAVNVTVPCESTAWELGGKALYLQPSASGNAGGFARTLSTAGGEAVDFGRNPNWAWGFMIEGAYHFNTGNDLNLNWYHINSSRSGASNAVRTINANIFNDARTSILPGNTTTITSRSASIEPKWDAVNLEFGQHVDFGENKSIRFHGGFEYARVVANSTLGMAGTEVFTDPVLGLSGTRAFNLATTSNPTYNGFGPRVGADMKYDWGNGLGIYANAASALLAGSSKFSVTETDVAIGRGVTLNGSATVVVPELEGKLGATYTYAMAQGDLTLDAGWMWVNYFNVIRSTGRVATDNSVSADFGIQGPFVGLKWLGNVA
ncbi:MAG: Lpg1974 family pore-forming outer membrane protein [Legionellaceae bacterium]|nr:Lpg1974 family pore-forming outer membrane protein [Legionellaceae bacterium]